jgi:hypothetical protein
MKAKDGLTVTCDLGGVSGRNRDLDSTAQTLTRMRHREG